MPGGSVNGRPFRESPNSYSRCGVPCGHPDRYSTSSVVRVGVTPAPNPRGRVTLDGPLENIETEGQRQLKQLAKKQTETKLNLQEHIARHRVFTEKVVYKPKTAEVKGVKSLEDYSRIGKQDDELEFLRQCGLSESEIQYKRSAEAEVNSTEPSSQPTVKQRKYGVDPQVKNEVLQDIQEKIDQKTRQYSNPDTFSGAVHISRHEMELENSLNSNRSQSQFLNCLITTKKDDELHPDHPMNHLHDIMKNITKPQNKKKKKKKKKHVTEDEQSTEPNESQEIANSSVDEKLDHVGNSLIGPVCPVDKEEIIRCRLTIEEIRQIERFRDYKPGDPSHILYLKNLSKKVTELDLASLFIHFQKDGIPPTLKLLKGKMRGQAFITFDSSMTATEALDLINGYMLKEQPIVIQYGRRFS